MSVSPFQPRDTHGNDKSSGYDAGDDRKAPLATGAVETQAAGLATGVVWFSVPAQSWWR